MEHNCPFCAMVREARNEEVGQDGTFFWKLDIHPVSAGHLILMPVRHIYRLAGLTERELLGLQDAIIRGKHYIKRTNLVAAYEKLLERKLTEHSPAFVQKALEQLARDPQPIGFNYGVNEGEAAGETVPHLHMHLIPRYKGDVLDPVGGVRHMFHGMGNYKKPPTFPVPNRIDKNV